MQSIHRQVLLFSALALAITGALSAQTHIRVAPQIKKLDIGPLWGEPGHIDADGLIDVCNPAAPAFWLNQADGTFQFWRARGIKDDISPLVTWAGPTSVLTDVDGDGDNDLVQAAVERWPWFKSLMRFPPDVIVKRVKYVAPIPNVLFINDGNKGFIEDDVRRNGRGTRHTGPARMPNVALPSACVAAGDVDGDGDVDLFFGSWPGPCELYLNDGRGYFTDVSKTHFPVVSTYTASAAFGDLDGDGDLDLFVSHGVTGVAQDYPAIYLNDGKGRFRQGKLANAIRTWHAMCALADVDRDGDLDGLVHMPAILPYKNPTLALYRNNGKGGLSLDLSGVPAEPAFQGGWMSLADINSDGAIDIVEQGSYTDSTGFLYRILINDGKGAFKIDRSALNNMYRFSGPIPADIDGDGDVDLLVDGHIHYNTHRQLFTDRAELGKVSTIKLYAQKDHVMHCAISLRRNTVRLPGLGLFHLDLASMLRLPPLTFKTAGNQQFQFTVPNDSRLLGVELFTQALDVHVTGSDSHLTGLMRDVVTR